MKGRNTFSLQFLKCLGLDPHTMECRTEGSNRTSGDEAVKVLGHHLLALLALLWASEEHLLYHILIVIGICEKSC